MPHLVTAEVAPAGPALAELVAIAAFVVALGLCLIAKYFVTALFGAAEKGVGWIPWVGSKIKGSLHSIEQRLTNALGGAVAGLDHQIAAMWYRLAGLVKWLVQEIAANAGTLAAIAAVIAGLPGFSDWRAFIRKVKASLLWAEQHAIGAVHTLTRPLYANVTALSRWTRAQIRVLRHAIDVTIPHSIAGLRHRTRVLERAVERDWKLLKKHERLLGIGAMTGVVAVVLSRLGLGWARCNNVGKVGKNLCGMNPGLLESLLADTALILSAISIVTLAEEVLAIEDEVIGFVKQGFVELRDVQVPSAAEALASGEW